MPESIGSEAVEPAQRDRTPAVAGRLVLIAGATSASGLAAARALTGAGARVVAVGRDGERLESLAATVARESASRGDAAPGALHVESCDLADEASVTAMAGRVHAAHGRVDGVLHLVGGWRGGGGLAGQTDDDYRFLEQSLTALRHVSRVFDTDLRASDTARVAMVSSTAVARPLAGGANYAAVKAASEAWMRAIAQGFAKAARDSGAPLRAASVIFRVTSLGGLEERLAQSFVDLWSADAAEINGEIVDLSSA